MGVPEIAHFTLSEPAYDLWLKGALLEELGIPDDNKTRVEIIGGEIVVSPGPLGDHALIVTDIHDAFTLARGVNPQFPWRSVQVMDFNLLHIGDGYIPDLIVLTPETFKDVAAARARNMNAKQVGMVVEVTSRSTASNDREPDGRRTRPTKWNGYAHEGVGYYLLVDRAPDKARVTLYTEPDQALGIYVSKRHWAFGETIALPEPFGIEIPTGDWLPGRE